MILGTFAGADYPLNAMPVRGMQEVAQTKNKKEKPRGSRTGGE